MPSVPHGNGDGLVVSNASDQVRVLHVDGIPVAWVAPGAKDVLSGLQRGRYIVQLRTFLGDSFEPPRHADGPGPRPARRHGPGARDAGCRSLSRSLRGVNVTSPVPLASARARRVSTTAVMTSKRVVGR